MGTARIWTLQSMRQPWGVVLYKKGDSPGGFNTLMAYHPASDAILVGFINRFGYFDEVDFLFDVFAQTLEVEGSAGRGERRTTVVSD